MPEGNLPHPRGGFIRGRPPKEQFHPEGVTGDVFNGKIALDFFVGTPPEGGEVVVRLLFSPAEFSGIMTSLNKMRPILLEMAR